MEIKQGFNARLLYTTGPRIARSLACTALGLYKCCLHCRPTQMMVTRSNCTVNPDASLMEYHPILGSDFMLNILDSRDFRKLQATERCYLLDLSHVEVSQ